MVTCCCAQLGGIQPGEADKVGLFVVVDAVAASNGEPAVAEHVPTNTESRAPSVQGVGVDIPSTVAECFHRSIGYLFGDGAAWSILELRDPHGIVFVGTQVAEVVVPHTEIYGQVAGHLDIILDEWSYVEEPDALFQPYRRSAGGSIHDRAGLTKR